MNRDNNTMLTSPNLSYTSRDYKSIYEDLMKSIPLLTKSWEPKNENDPGLVLIKMMSMIGDMLSYNLDKNALEVFPRTVLQRENAQQIFKLIGYKMHWWRSAQVEASFTNANSFPVYIGKYNAFTTSDGNITYTNLDTISIPGGTYGQTSYKTTLIQGTPVTPILNSSIKSNYNGEWHDSYDYNLNVDQFINNRLYLNYQNIEETSIQLIDNDETPFSVNEWKLVKNLNLSETEEKVFEFDIDEDGTSYIQLPNYWNTKYVITKFKLFFVLSSGESGEIEENTLSTIAKDHVYVDQDNVSIDSVLEQLAIYNTPSTYGHNPETCTEARMEAEKYQNTIDTLVVLKDFEKAVRRMDGVANVVATDNQMDPHKDEMTNHDINLYIVRKEDYNNIGWNYIYASDYDSDNDELFKENVIGELKSYKLMPYNINVKLENYVDWIDWTVSGQIFLRHPIDINENYDLMVRINNNLLNRFNTTTLDFNEAVNYMDVIECIMKTDKNIWHVDLDTAAIEYTKAKRNVKGNKVGKKIISKYMIFKDGKYTGYYTTSLGCSSIYVNKLLPYIIDENGKIKDEYQNIYDEEDPAYIIANDSNSLSNIVTYPEEDIDTSVTYGGNGYGKNAANRIIREDGLEKVYGLFDNESGPREYEIYNNHIIDFTGYEPIDTGYIIDSTSKPYKIFRYGDHNTKIYTGYTIDYDSRMYLEDSSDAHRIFTDKVIQLLEADDYDKVSLMTQDEVDNLYNNYIELKENVMSHLNLYTNLKAILVSLGDSIYNEDGSFVDNLSEEQDRIFKGQVRNYNLKIDDEFYDYSTFKNKYMELNNENINYNNILSDLSNNKIKEVYRIIDITFNDTGEWTGEVIDKSTGEMFVKRGDYYYPQHMTYDEDSGEILDNYGEVQYDEAGLIIREPQCREDITGEYIQEFVIDDYFESESHKSDKEDLKFEFYLGQDENGQPVVDSIGNTIEAYPIKPYSLFIYVDGDEDIIADNGSGRLNSTPGLLNGWGSIDYNTGKISFRTNILPESFKIMYKINKLTYSHYINFDTSKLFVNPKYIKNNNRK